MIGKANIQTAEGTSYCDTSVMSGSYVSLLPSWKQYISYLNSSEDLMNI